MNDHLTASANKGPETPDGGTAFPQMFNTARREGMGGMSLRDYFAAKALGNLLTPLLDAYEPHLDHDDKPVAPECEWIARQAYLYADAMLKARSA